MGPLALSQRKERSTVGQYAPNLLGYTRATKGGTMGSDAESNHPSWVSVRWPLIGVFKLRFSKEG